MASAVAIFYFSGDSSVINNFQKSFSRRSLTLLSVFLAVTVLLTSVLFRMQVLGYSTYQEKVLDQITVGSALRAARGNIYDRNGNLLATTETAYRIYISPVDIRQAMKKSGGNEDERIAAGLAELLGMEYDTVYKKTQKFHLLDETILKNASKEMADRVLLFAANNCLGSMVHVEATAKRSYPYNSLAAQVLGFTGGDGQGLFGLELYYDTYLTGEDGKYVTAKDAGGHDMPNGYIGYIPAKDGLSMTTTLDLYIQTQLELALLQAAEDSAAKNRVSGIVMDVDTGAVLAMATLPSYDLNDPYTLAEEAMAELAAYEKDSAEYKEKKNELLYEMWNNKAITETYEPGSTFKIITSAMGLEKQVISAASPFHCSGVFRVGGVSIRCHKRTGHGGLCFAEGLQQSCNPVFMQVAARVGRDTFYDYVSAFGYLQKTGIDLPGETNSIFHQRENIHEVELATAAFGQRFNVTMIQQLTAICAVANGGKLVTPHVMSSFSDADGNTVLSYKTNVKNETVSAATCAEISRILEEGVSGGNGVKNAYVCGYKIAAKTGTSEKLNGGRVGSCVAYAPADDPEIAVIIIVDEPSAGMVYGSVVAAPYVGSLLSNVLPYLGHAPVYSEEEATLQQISVGDYTGLSLEEAAKKIRAIGLSVEYGDDKAGDTVTVQFPSAGEVVTKEGGRVILYTGGAPVTHTTVPNILGKSAAEANAALLDAGLNVCIKGAVNYRLGAGATVIAVSHEAGTRLPRGSAVTVTFRYLDADEQD